MEHRILVRKDGSVLESWMDTECKLHRENGLPAVLTTLGYEAYYIHGELQGRRFKQEETVAMRFENV